MSIQDKIPKLYYSNFDFNKILKVKLTGRYGNGYIAVVLPDNKIVRFTMRPFEQRKVGTTHIILNQKSKNTTCWKFAHSL